MNLSERMTAFRPGRKPPGVIESKNRCVLRRERIHPFRNVGKHPRIVGWKRVSIFSTITHSTYPDKGVTERNA